MSAWNLLVIATGLIILAERIIKTQLIHQFFKRSQQEIDRYFSSLAVPEVERISILQPILSGDPTLWDCLSKNLEIQTKYPLEFLWLIDEDDDLAQAGCPEILERYPNANVKIITLPLASDQVSPKMFKLIEGLKYATGNLIAVLDDDTVLPDQAFEQSLPFLNKPGVGVAFGLPYYVNFSNLWSSLVSGVVNGNNLLTYIPYTFLISPFTINGMFFIMKREILERVNGFNDLQKFIVDDYAIAQHFRRYGYQLAQTPVCHGISTQIQDASHYFNLLNRWFIFPQASILKSANLTELIVFYILAFIPTIFPLTVCAFTLISPSLYSGIYALIYFGFSYFMLSQFNQNYFNNATPSPKMIWLLGIQILLPINLLISLLSPRKINWRGHIMELKEDGGFQFIQRRAS